MSTSDATSNEGAPEASAAAQTRMDVRTTQQMLREMTTLTGALFSLLQPQQDAHPETTPEAAPSSSAAPTAAIVPPEPRPALPGPSIPLPDLPVTAAEPPIAPQPPVTAPVASIPLPSAPADKEDESVDSNRSRALMNEIAFLDE